MKTVKILITILMVFAVVSAVNAQPYAKIFGGYGLGLANQVIYDKTTTTGTAPNIVTNHDQKSGSYGEGINFGAGFGYMFTKNIGLEVAGAYHLGRKFENTGTFTSGGAQYNWTEKTWGEGIYIMPGLVAAAPQKGGIVPYTRFGMILGLVKQKGETTTTLSNSGKEVYERTGGVALGIQGAAGIQYMVAKNISIFGEIFGIGMNYCPDKRTWSEYYTGQTKPADITYKSTWASTEQNVEGLHYYSFSSFGLNIGAAITFGK